MWLRGHGGCARVGGRRRPVPLWTCAAPIARRCTPGACSTCGCVPWRPWFSEACLEDLSLDGNLQAGARSAVSSNNTALVPRAGLDGALALRCTPCWGWQAAAQSPVRTARGPSPGAGRWWWVPRGVSAGLGRAGLNKGCRRAAPSAAQHSATCRHGRHRNLLGTCQNAARRPLCPPQARRGQCTRPCLLSSHIIPLRRPATHMHARWWLHTALAAACLQARKNVTG